MTVFIYTGLPLWREFFSTKNTPEYRQLMSWFVPRDPEDETAYWKAYQELVVNVQE